MEDVIGVREQLHGKEDGVPIKHLSLLRIEGGNIVVEVDKEQYQKGINEPNYSVVGRLSLQKGDLIPTTMELRCKLEALWKISML